MARILSISSQVVRGHVGNSALIFPLMRLGHEVLPVPTALLAHHPGHYRNVARSGVPEMFRLGEGALTSPRPHPVDGILVGYLAEARQAAAAARLIALARSCRPHIPVLLDPVCADEGALYAARGVPVGIAQDLLPLADIATPNVTELAALTAPEDIAEAPGWREGAIVARARQLGVPCVAVTSAPARRGDRIANLVITADAAHRVETPSVDCAVHGTGDLLSGLILAGLLGGGDPVAATARAAAAVHDVLVETARLGADELALAAAQDRILSPRTKAEITAL